ncbi:MAG: aromatic ring-hydroxylating dioxygenase subunit alpha [Chloroflexi bacterium]|nr:aromatic ring-hydroxylating dioxygenase subunit alpha [Chloroflexota bacterium]MBV9597360.1 aromatic ring-hydroxylating dioxygenase subunit alpha [Chloroflexota bacterium]
MALTTTDFQRLSHELDQGLALPTAWYTDQGIAELERRYIFRRSWQYVGRTEQVAQAGDYFTAQVGDIPVVIVRSAEGIQGLVNVCRHRRHEVMSGAGNRRSLQCPYHAWTYELDGRLRTAPRSERELSFCKEDYPLLRVQVATWGRWIFANPDPDAPPLTEILGELPAILASSGMDLDQLRFWRRDDWVSHANWKILIENFLECYHCPVQHPAFSAVIDVRPDAYRLEAYRWFSSQTGSVRDTISGQAPPYDAQGDVQQAQFHFLWPNFTISVNPGRPNLSLDVWLPDGPTRTRGFSEHYFGPDVPADWAEEMIAFNAQVGDEDDELTSSVQRGIDCGLPDQGRFLANSEHLCIHFQKLVLSAVARSAILCS